MGVRSWIVGRFAKSLSFVTAIGTTSLAGRLSSDAETLIGMYRKNPISFSCVRLRSDAFSDPTLILQQRNNAGEYETINDHAFLRLMRRPNPNMDEAMFFRAWSISRQVTGTFYAEIIRSGAEVPAELYPLDPSMLKSVITEDDNGRSVITAYEWSDGTNQKTIAAADMLVMNEWNLGGTISPIAVALYHLDNDNKHTDYIRAFWENGGVPYGLLKVAGRVNDDEADEMREAWKAEHGNAFAKQHRIAVLDERAEFQKIGANLDELVSVTLREVDEARICMALGVPPLIVYSFFGLIRSTFSNLEEAWRQFWSTTMSSDMRAARSWLMLTLLPQFIQPSRIRSGEFRLYWDVSNVVALQDNVDAVNERILKQWSGGILTLDETRKRLGYADYPNEEFSDFNSFQLVALARLMGGLTESANVDVMSGVPALPSVTASDEMRFAIAHLSQRIAETNGGNGSRDEINEWLQRQANSATISDGR